MDGSGPLSHYSHSLFDGLFDQMEEMHNNMMNQYRSFFDSPKSDNIFQTIDKEISQMKNRMTNMESSMQTNQNSVNLNPLFSYGKQIAEQNNNEGHLPLRTHAELNGKPVGNIDDKGRTILFVAILVPSDSDSYDRANTLASLDQKPHEPSPPLDPSEETDDGWLVIFSERAKRFSFVNRWLVCLSLFLCIISLIWICLAIIRTAPRRRPLYARAEEIKVVGLSVGEKKFLVETKAQPEGPPPPYNAEPILVKTPLV